MKLKSRKNKRNFNKYILIFLIIVLFSGLITSILEYKNVYAENEQTNEELLAENIVEELNNIDLSDMELLLNDIENDFGLLDNKSIYEKVLSIINGEYFADYGSLLSAIINLFFGSFSKYIPLLISIFVIIILCQIIHSFKSNQNENSIGNIINFVGFALIIILISVAFKNIIEISTNTLKSLSTQINVIFPVLLSMLTALGSLATVSIYKPIVVLLGNLTTLIFNNLLYPLFIVAFIFIIIGNLSPNVKLKRFNGLISSLFKWSVGFIFTLFSGILAIQGISAGKYDHISITATRFALKSYIPLIGGYLSDGLDYIVLSSVLIKNSIGLVGILLVVISILSPILLILALKFGLQLLSACVEPVGSNSNMSNFINDCSKILIYPLVIILAVSFMYIISLGLIMCTANLV